MKILFIGTVEFSYHLLETLIEENSELIGVITDTDNQINSDYVNLKHLKVLWIRKLDLFVVNPIKIVVIV